MDDLFAELGMDSAPKFDAAGRGVSAAAAPAANANRLADAADVVADWGGDDDLLDLDL